LLERFKIQVYSPKKIKKSYLTYFGGILSNEYTTISLYSIKFVKMSVSIYIIKLRKIQFLYINAKSNIDLGEQFNVRSII